VKERLEKGLNMGCNFNNAQSHGDEAFLCPCQGSGGLRIARTRKHVRVCTADGRDGKRERERERERERAARRGRGEGEEEEGGTKASIKCVNLF